VDAEGERASEPPGDVGERAGRPRSSTAIPDSARRCGSVPARLLDRGTMLTGSRLPDTTLRPRAQARAPVAAERERGVRERRADRSGAS
jgi:hypothetical protein